MNLKTFIAITRFNKPIGSFLLLYPTLWAIIIFYNSSVDINIIIIFIVCVFLTRSAGCVINDIFDYKIDDKVKRTKNRPLASKVMRVKQAWILFVIITIITFSLTVLFLKTLTIFMSIPALLLFSTYPLMKRYFVLPQLYLGLTFSFSIIMVSCQFIDCVNINGILLYIANVIWVLAYDTYYALVDIEDDKKIGIRTSAIAFGSHVKLIIAILYLFFYAILFYLGLSLKFDNIYFIINILSFLYTFINWSKCEVKNHEKCFELFLKNNNIGLLVTLSFVANAIVTKF